MLYATRCPRPDATTPMARSAGFVARLQNLVSVRPATPQEGDTPRAIISRAEYAVERDNFADALTELDRLPDAAKTAMAEWVNAAQARLDAANAIDDINRVLLSQLPG